MTAPSEIRPSLFNRFLGAVERAGNALPQPATLFAGLALLVVLLSGVFASAGMQVVNPTSGEVVPAVSLLNLEGLHRILTETVRNFINFPPLGIVIVCLLGIAVAEHTGLIGAFVRLLVLTAPRRMLTAMVVFAGVTSNLAGDVGYVLLIPLAAALFHAVGRHPLAGLAAGFAGVSGGFSANLMIGAFDLLLAGLTQSAAEIIQPGYQVTGLANYYFMAASTFVVTAAGTWVTDRIVEPRLGPYRGDAAAEPLTPLSDAEKRGLRWTLGFIAGFTALILWGLLPVDGFLRDPRHADSILRSHFFSSLVPFILLFGFGSGLAYGLGARTVHSDADVVKGMEHSMSTLGAYLVLAFFAAQFIAYFNWTNLGVITAVKGAELIRAAGLEDMPVPLMIALILFSGAVNLVVGSASAKWALLAPVFVPMFMLLGYSPELVQAAYRIGDSCTNIITPLMAYFPLIISFARRYDPQAGMGTLIAAMLPYSLAFLALWTLLLVLWITLGLPVGINAPLRLVP